MKGTVSFVYDELPEVHLVLESVVAWQVAQHDEATDNYFVEFVLDGRENTVRAWVYAEDLSSFQEAWEEVNEVELA